MTRRTNNYKCKTRAIHRCDVCGCVIPIGSLVRTISTKYNGRCWLCEQCDEERERAIEEASWFDWDEF